MLNNSSLPATSHKKSSRPHQPQKASFPFTFKSDQKEEIDEYHIVLKIGSSSLSNVDGTIRLSVLSQFVELVYKLICQGYKVAIVSSGAVSVGCNCLKLTERPTDTISKQACAAVGQSKLMRLYDDLFSIFNIPVAQVLLTRDNIGQEDHYLNAVNTIRKLMSQGIVTIINENDTVSVFELKLGDNDTLSAMVASMIKAKWLFLVTDVDALYTGNPQTDPLAQPIRVIPNVQEQMDVFLSSTSTAGAPPTPVKSGAWGTGGMQTKLTAAFMASHAGVTTGIVSFNNLHHVTQMLQGDRTVGSTFLPHKTVLTGRRKWISIAIAPSGEIVIDKGAAEALYGSSSLFASGITMVTGSFQKGACVSIYTYRDDGKPSNEQDPSGIDPARHIEIGRGLVAFGNEELLLIKGKQSKDISHTLSQYYNQHPDRFSDSLIVSHVVSSIVSSPGEHSRPIELGLVISRNNLAIYEKSRPYGVQESNP